MCARACGTSTPPVTASVSYVDVSPRPRNFFVGAGTIDAPWADDPLFTNRAACVMVRGPDQMARLVAYL